MPAFRVTERDIDILGAIREYGLMVAPQIAKLFFSADRSGEVNSRCKHHLRMLFHYGYVARGEQPQKPSEGPKPLVYFLDKAGASLLSQKRGEQVQARHPSDLASYTTLQHRLATNDVRIAIVLAARKHGWQIVRWLDERALRSPGLKDTVTLVGKEGGREQAAVVPDGFFQLETGKKVFHFFLEIDMGTVTGEAARWGRRDWARKVRAYLEYHASGKYKERYHTEDMRLLTVTTGEKRSAHLREVTQKAGGKARFWFTTFQLTEKEGVLTAPVWTVAGRDGHYSLVAPDS